MDIKTKDGILLRNIPDGTPEEAIRARIDKIRAERGGASGGDTPPAPESGFIDAVTQGAGNLAAGAVRGAGSIGATLLSPYDIARDALAGKGLSLESNMERRAAMDAALQSMGAEPDSFAYGAGKIGGEIAGTAGAGGALAKGAQAIPALAKFAPLIQSGGFNLGGAATGSNAANAALRAAGGAIQGGAQAAMVDPSQAGTGAMIGAGAPVAVRAAGAVGNKLGGWADSMARRLMQSALKPTAKQQATGQAKRAIQTMLDEGINATPSGVEKIKGSVGDINARIAQALDGSTATISKQNVMPTLDDVRQRFMTQVSPTSDLAAIQSVSDDFLAHPGAVANDMPVQMAQALKQGTYRALKGKYGEVGSAATEAQKALARGLKENIAKAVPDVAPLNARESRLLDALAVAERRAMMDQNKNPLGLAAISPSPAGLAAFLADRSAGLKSVAARGLHSAASSPIPQNLMNLVDQYGLLGAPSVIATSP